MAVSLTHRNRWPRNLSHTASLVGVAGGHDGDECGLSDTPGFAAFGSSYKSCVVSGTPQRFFANQFNNSFIAIICSAT